MNDIDKLKSVKIDSTKYVEVGVNDFIQPKDEIYKVNPERWEEVESSMFYSKRGTLINPIRRKISLTDMELYAVVDGKYFKLDK